MAVMDSSQMGVTSLTLCQRFLLQTEAAKDPQVQKVKKRRGLRESGG
jgi:hypothetical protein